MRCPHCGASNPSGDAFCGECGQPLGIAAPQDLAAPSAPPAAIPPAGTPFPTPAGPPPGFTPAGTPPTVALQPPPAGEYRAGGGGPRPILLWAGVGGLLCIGCLILAAAAPFVAGRLGIALPAALGGTAIAQLPASETPSGDAVDATPDDQQPPEATAPPAEPTRRPSRTPATSVTRSALPTPKPTAAQPPAGGAGLGVAREELQFMFEALGLSFSEGDLIEGLPQVIGVGGEDDSTVLQLVGPPGNLVYVALLTPGDPSFGGDSTIFLFALQTTVLPDWDNGPIWLTAQLPEVLANGDAAETSVQGTRVVLEPGPEADTVVLSFDAR
jgi:hypothetical protein